MAGQIIFTPIIIVYRYLGNPRFVCNLPDAYLADDPMVDLEGSRKAAALIPQAKLVVAPDCGHWAQLEEHELFLNEVSAFCARWISGTVYEGVVPKAVSETILNIHLADGFSSL